MSDGHALAAAGCALASAYDALAAGFAARWFEMRLLEDMRRLVARLPPGGRVLDVGCGPGRDVAWLAEQGFAALGVDLSRGMLAEGRARGVPGALIQADMRRLPFRDGTFAGIWACASLLHIPRAQAGATLRELARVVRPGHLYLSVKQGTGQEWIVPPEGGRILFTYYTPGELRALLHESGFVVLEQWQSADQAGRSRPWIGAIARAKA
jgi:SAM-dependent methyltransferase